VFAEFERAMIAERVRAGLARATVGVNAKNNSGPPQGPAGASWAA
jgi:DNA invertase Pin-like site-specific DNA recombinase